MTALAAYSATLTHLLPIINPIGMAPMFLALTSAFSHDSRIHLSWRVAIYSFFLLTGTMFVGGVILSFFGLSIPIVRLAGGLVVFHTAWDMLNTKPRMTGEEHEETAASNADEISFFPLTIPVTVGAGCMAISITIGSQVIGKVDTTVAAVAGMLTLAVSIFACYRNADWLFGYLGKVGTNVVTKLAAFLLLAVGVQIIWTGVRGLLAELSH